VCGGCHKKKRNQIEKARTEVRANRLPADGSEKLKMLKIVFTIVRRLCYPQVSNGSIEFVHEIKGKEIKMKVVAFVSFLCPTATWSCVAKRSSLGCGKGTQSKEGDPTVPRGVSSSMLLGERPSCSELFAIGSLER
jgi:hypothetical protein